MRPYHIAWIVCFVALIVFVGMRFAMQTPPSASSSIAGVELGGPFTLTDQNGKRVTEKSWPGKYLLVYFGFTHCPDICPVGLSRIIEALNALPPELRKKIQPIFITVDPARDTAKALKDYVVLFDKNMVGLTGTTEEIKHVIKLYRVYAQKDTPQKGSGTDYMVNHSGYTYLMNPEGGLAGIYPHETTPDDMAKQLKTAISN